MSLFLVVEDDKQIRKFIRFSLKAEGHECLEAATGREAMQSIATQNPEVIVLDLGLPDIDGVDIIREVREFSQVPIVVVSARDQDAEKVEALDAGADDYITKPFSINELLARIRVIFRHQKGPEQQQAPKPYQIGGLVVDAQKHSVTLEGEPVHFTPMEYKLLVLLVQNAGKVLTHNYLLREVWGSYLDSDMQSLRVFMANIRRKLENNPATPRYLFTEVGIGYRFAEE